MGLSRQWAFLLFPSYAYILFIKNNEEWRKNVIKFLVFTFTIAFLYALGFTLNYYLNLVLLLPLI